MEQRKLVQYNISQNGKKGGIKKEKKKKNLSRNMVNTKIK